VGGEFLTRTYRISGEYLIRGEPLLDYLNDIHAFFVQLEKVFISPLLDPAVLVGNYKTANVAKSSVGLVVLSQVKDGMPRREGQYSGRDFIDRKVLIVAAGFEVMGVLRLHPSVDINNFVRTTPEQYIPLFDASATLAARRDVVFKGPIILLNRNEIEVFCQIEKPGTQA
jgi:hypothetical protein